LVTFNDDDVPHTPVHHFADRYRKYQPVEMVRPCRDPFRKDSKC
jgi:hypothetical protein